MCMVCACLCVLMCFAGLCTSKYMSGVCYSFMDARRCVYMLVMLGVCVIFNASCVWKFVCVCVFMYGSLCVCIYVWKFVCV